MFFLKRFSADYSIKKEKALTEINQREEGIKKLSESDFKDRIKAIKEKIKEGISANNFLIEVFTLTREAAWRTLRQRHFDVQILGGIGLYEEKAVEMKTGEGKTLVATLPVSLSALEGKGVHIITVNDYLAKRDAVWMGQIYNYLGLTVGCITQEGAFLYDSSYKTGEKEDLEKDRDELGGFKVFQEFLRPVERKEAYLADITYGTNTEFGFDYLRDNLAYSFKEKVQREYHYAIIDEVDSVLIDEARTPLIISFPDEEAPKLYAVFASLAPQFKQGVDFVLEEKEKAIKLAEEGLDKAEKIFGFNIFDEKGIIYVHHLETALKAHHFYLKDRDYIVKDGQIIIVDEFTGRLLLQRRYSGGLHQAIEAKERVVIKEESRTIATITLQNYFRMYPKLAGMTGTALTSAEEFKKVYNLEVIVIPTNKPMKRKNLTDKIFRTQEEKLKAITKEIKERYGRGQPVLVGTPSVEKNELLGLYFKKAGIPHNILNAKHHEKEGEIIAQAGKLFSVTVATNMAGRGVDIVLGGNPPEENQRQKILELGGLHVIGTERHEARRIDNQLRGRSGRQGDPGSSQFFISLEDDLIRIFAPSYLSSLMQKLGWPENEPIEHPMVAKAIEAAQSKIEGFYFDIRKHVLEYDDVINKQRVAFYRMRDEALIKEKNGLFIDYLIGIFNTGKEDFPEEDFEKKKEILGNEKLMELLKITTLRILDNLWMNHIERTEFLRDSTALRAYGGQDSLVEYKKESYYFYKELEGNFIFYLIQNVKNILAAEIKIQNK